MSMLYVETENSARTDTRNNDVIGAALKLEKVQFAHRTASLPSPYRSNWPSLVLDSSDSSAISVQCSVSFWRNTLLLINSRLLDLFSSFSPTPSSQRPSSSKQVVVIGCHPATATPTSLRGSHRRRRRRPRCRRPPPRVLISAEISLARVPMPVPRHARW